MRLPSFSNIFRLGVKELWSLVRDPTMLVLIVYTFSISIYVAATAMPESLHHAAIAIVDEDGSPLSARIASSFYPPHFLAPRMITLAEMDAGMDNGDFTFVLDTCHGFVRALEAELPRPTTVHLGAGVAVTVRELVATIGRLLGRTLAVGTDAGRVRPPASEVDVLLSDPSCAEEWLGWRPTVSLEEGLRRTIAFMQERGLVGGERYHV